MSHAESFVGPRSSPPTRNCWTELLQKHQLPPVDLEAARVRRNINSPLSSCSPTPTAAMISVILVVFLVQLALNLISSVGAQAVNDLVRTQRASLLSKRLQLISRMYRHGGSSPNSRPNNPNKPSKTSNSAMKSSAYSAKCPTSPRKTISPSGRV